MARIISTALLAGVAVLAAAEERSGLRVDWFGHPVPSEAAREYVLAHKAIAINMREAVTEVLPEFNNATQGLLLHDDGTINDAGPAAGMGKLEKLATRHLVSIMGVLPQVMHAASELTNANRTKDQKRDAMGLLLELAARLKVELAHSTPMIVEATTEFLRSLDPSWDNASSSVEALEGSAEEADLDSMKAALAELATVLSDVMRCSSCKEHISLMCVANIAGILQDLMTAVYHVVQNVPVDCVGALEAELDCAASVAAGLQDLAEVSQRLARAVFHCGKINEGCMELLGSGFSWFAVIAEKSLAASANCVWPPALWTTTFMCTIDTLDAVNAAAHAANDLNWMLEACNPAVPAGPAAVLMQVVARLQAEMMAAMPGFAQADAAQPRRASQLRGAAAGAAVAADAP